MNKVKVRTLRPLNGEPEGKVKTYAREDAERLARSGAVKILGPAKKAQGASRSNKAENASRSNKSN